MYDRAHISIKKDIAFADFYSGISPVVVRRYDRYGMANSRFSFIALSSPPVVARTTRDTAYRSEMSISRPRVSGQTLVTVAASSAVLGPLLDNYHSQFGVLAYRSPIEFHATVAGMSMNFTTALFTSPLFIVAGLIIAYGTLAINSNLRDGKFPVMEVSGPRAMATIAAFSSIYYLSAAIPKSEVAIITGPLLTLLAFAEWCFMDKSLGGLVMGLLSGLCGPLLEVGLINFGDLYSYSSPEMLGIPLFIAPVYFAGGPAVGNLARAIEGYCKLRSEEMES